MSKKDRLPYQRRSDAAGYIPKEDWEAMTPQEQEEYLRPFFHPRETDGIKGGVDDGARGHIQNSKIIVSVKKRN